MNHIKLYSLLALLSIAMSARAQVKLEDKSTTKVDLGFGIEQTIKSTTAAVTVISGEELQQTSASSLADALYGRLLGLNVFQVGGFVGDENKGATLNIRGYGTTSEKEILVLVDGYERPIDRLTVEEVESVTVYKDAAAVALFGHEAINGAINVKTKRGKDGRTNLKVGYSHKFTFDAEFAEMLDAGGFTKAMEKARANDGLSPAYTTSELEKFADGSDPFFYPNVNWKDKAFKDTGSENNAFVSIDGGNDKVQYYSILNYTGATGLFNGTEQPTYSSQLKYSKANIRTNVDFELSSTTKISASVFGMFMETNRPNGIDADGATWNVYATPSSAFPYQTKGGFWGGNGTFKDRNVAAQIQSTGFQKTHQRQLWANARLTQDLSFWVDGLSISMGGGYDNASITIDQNYTTFQYGFDYINGSGKEDVSLEGDKQGKLEFNHWTDRQWRSSLLDVGVHYKTSFTEKDNFAASLVYNARAEVRDDQNNTFYRMNYLGHFHYDYDNKYMIDLSMGFNGSNRSYPAKWGFSPVLALGWIYADNPGKVFTYGKLRASGGIQHTDYVPEAGLWLERWNANNGDFMFGTSQSTTWGTFITAFATKDFAQERALKFNLGTDLRLFNALDITLDGFYNKRDHILVSARTQNSSVVGIQSAYADKGEVLSYGVEFGTRFAKEIAKDLHLNASASITWASNEYKATIENPSSPHLSVIGHRVNEAWGMEAIGFFKDQADIDNSPIQQFSKVQAGDVKFKDQNGDGVINQQDRVALGYGTDIPELNYAFGLGLEYRGIGLNLIFQGTGNYMKNFRSVDGVWNVLADNRNLSVDYYNNSWDVAGDAARYPRLTSQNNANNNQDSDIWFQKVNFLKLRNCEVYYKLPSSLISRAKLSNAKIFIQGQNLFSTDNVEAMDAEVLSTAYPVLKSVNIGLSLTF